MKRHHVCSKPGCPNFAPCPEHSRPRNASWSEDRDLAKQYHFRKALLTRAGGVCERCGVAPATVAHHVRPGYGEQCGLALCDACHMALDHKARRVVA